MRTTFFDDDAMGPASNDKPALAGMIRRFAAAANDFAAMPYPIVTWVGGNGNYAEADAEPMVRRVWFPGSLGPSRIEGKALVVPIADTTGVPATGLDLNHGDQDQLFTIKVPQTPGIREHVNESSEHLYPRYAVTAPLFPFHMADHSSPATARQLIVQSGEDGLSFGPQIRAGMANVRQILHPSAEEAFPLSGLATGADITAEAIADLRDFIVRLWLERGIQFSWNLCKDNGAGAFGVTIPEDTYRYIHDVEWGQGGFAPSVTGPGVNVPARFSGRGLEQTVRCYVRAYAWMTGTTDAGNLGVYNRNNAGGMTGPTALTHGASITGTTPRWWPNTTTFDPANDPYFLLNGNPAYLADHVLLCGRRTSGSTDQLRIGAYAMYVCPSSA